MDIHDLREIMGFVAILGMSDHSKGFISDDEIQCTWWISELTQGFLL